MKPSGLITVCSKCLRASCWQGVLYCDDYVGTGAVHRSRADLRRLKREHPSYWKSDQELAGNEVRIPRAANIKKEKASLVKVRITRKEFLTLPMTLRRRILRRAANDFIQDKRNDALDCEEDP